MATLPQQPQLNQKKSLQININSEDDAKAVIQHLGKIKARWEVLRDSVGIESIEFCIADSIRRNVEAIVTGAVNWCRTYTKSVLPFEGNAHYPLPHYQAPAPAQVILTRKPEAPAPPAQPVQPLGKTKRLVTANAGDA